MSNPYGPPPGPRSVTWTPPIESTSGSTALTAPGSVPPGNTITLVVMGTLDFSRLCGGRISHDLTWTTVLTGIEPAFSP